MPAVKGGKGGNPGRDARTERLEAELRANLKRRKEQVRSRARGASEQPAGPQDRTGSGEPGPGNED